MPTGESLLNDGSAVVLFSWVVRAIGYASGPHMVHSHTVHLPLGALLIPWMHHVRHRYTSSTQPPPWMLQEDGDYVRGTGHTQRTPRTPCTFLPSVHCGPCAPCVAQVRYAGCVGCSLARVAAQMLVFGVSSHRLFPLCSPSVPPLFRRGERGSQLPPPSFPQVIFGYMFGYATVAICSLKYNAMYIEGPVVLAMSYSQGHTWCTPTPRTSH